MLNKLQGLVTKLWKYDWNSGQTLKFDRKTLSFHHNMPSVPLKCEITWSVADIINNGVWNLQCLRTGFTG